jgi:uncharacterized membrane protein
MSKRTLTASFQVLFSLVGTLDAGTLYWAHRMNENLPCTTGGGCDVVNSSSYAYVFGIPVSLLGAITYIVLLFASVLRLTTDSETTAHRVNVFLLAASLFGMCYSWYLQYIAAFRIGEFCIYCRVSAITMSLFFVTTVAAQALLRMRPPSAVTDRN